MPEIRVVPLGAGQEVGRSCILISIGGKNVMLDCGMHMGFNDDRRFPDFSFIADKGPLDDFLDCVIISHFHLDHCGALPYMSEMVGFKGPIYMTHPTKAICPVLLEDYRKIQVDIKGDTNFFTSQMIKECMRKVVAVNLHEIMQVDKDLKIKPYYAGHVLGAAMFEIRVGSESVVYTGDFNMTPDRHLGAAEIDACEPDLLISESTYATTIRDSKRARERDFLKKVHDCVDRGGKVLIPVFALGRAQELCILLESYWERMNLKVPIYFSQGLAERATDYYKLFISWTNEKIKRTFVQRNMFDFKHIKPFDVSYADQPGPMVLFATPGMLHSGQSLRVFEKWAPDEKNMVIMPGYCVQGTVGHKIINGAKKIELRGRQLDVKLAVEYMSFSAHADAKGIMQLIRNCQPRHVMFVHGEDGKMEFLKQKVEKEFNVRVFKPANGETVVIPTEPQVVMDASRTLVKRCLEANPHPSKRRCPFRGALILSTTAASAFDVATSSTPPALVMALTPEEALEKIGVKAHNMRFTVHVPLRGSVLDVDERAGSAEGVLQQVATILSKNDRLRVEPGADGSSLNVNGGDVVVKLVNMGEESGDRSMGIRGQVFTLTWDLQDEAVGGAVLQMIRGD